MFRNLQKKKNEKIIKVIKIKCKKNSQSTTFLTIKSKFNFLLLFNMITFNVLSFVIIVNVLFVLWPSSISAQSTPTFQAQHEIKHYASLAYEYQSAYSQESLWGNVDGATGGPSNGVRFAIGTPSTTSATIDVSGSVLKKSFKNNYYDETKHIKIQKLFNIMNHFFFLSINSNHP